MAPICCVTRDESSTDMQVAMLSGAGGSAGGGQRSERQVRRERDEDGHLTGSVLLALLASSQCMMRTAGYICHAFAVCCTNAFSLCDVRRRLRFRFWQCDVPH